MFFSYPKVFQFDGLKNFYSFTLEICQDFHQNHFSLLFSNYETLICEFFQFIFFSCMIPIRVFLLATCIFCPLPFSFSRHPFESIIRNFVPFLEFRSIGFVAGIFFQLIISSCLLLKQVIQRDVLCMIYYDIFYFFVLKLPFHNYHHYIFARFSFLSFLMHRFFSFPLLL